MQESVMSIHVDANAWNVNALKHPHRNFRARMGEHMSAIEVV